MQSLNRLKSERPRKAYDFYKTPYALCESALETFLYDEDVLFCQDNVLDPR